MIKLHKNYTKKNRKLKQIHKINEMKIKKTFLKKTLIKNKIK